MALRACQHQPYITKGLKVGKGVWVGWNSVILDGVEIGDGVIVAAGSIVTKELAEYGVYGGNPATLLKVRSGRDRV